MIFKRVLWSTWRIPLAMVSHSCSCLTIKIISATSVSSGWHELWHLQWQKRMTALWKEIRHVEFRVRQAAGLRRKQPSTFHNAKNTTALERNKPISPRIQVLGWGSNIGVVPCPYLPTALRGLKSVLILSCLVVLGLHHSTPNGILGATTAASTEGS